MYWKHEVMSAIGYHEKLQSNNAKENASSEDEYKTI
jgi:hypothetical protein